MPVSNPDHNESIYNDSPIRVLFYTLVRLLTSQAVINPMRESGNFSGLAAFAPLLLVAGLTLPEFVQADPAIPISQCREQSIDQSGFDECLILLVQQTESALNEMEANWLEKLSVDQQEAVSSSIAVSLAETKSNALAGEVDSAAETSGQVIAIVSEGALAEGAIGGNSRVINVDDAALRSETDVTESSDASSAALQAERFADLPALFRQFRSQRCEWEAGLMGANRAAGYQLACEIALNRQHVLHLRRLLVEKNATDVGGESFRGYYVRTASGGSFQSCDRRQDWWVTGSEEVLGALQRRYSDIAAENLEMVYVELRGRAGKPVENGPGADFVGAVEVATVNLMRPILEQDCRATATGVTPPPVAADELTDNDFADTDDSADATVLKTPAVTVDELGDAGFLYGYFSNWMSACAVDKLSVCQAQTQAEYSSEGEWMLSVDRSSQSDWRVRLIPTTENHLINGPLLLTIDDIENSTAKISVTEIEVGRGVNVAKGQRARNIMSRLRAGRSLDFEWLRPDQVSAKVSFSLAGITRALRYFDQAEK